MVDAFFEKYPVDPKLQKYFSYCSADEYPEVNVINSIVAFAVSKQDKKNGPDQVQARLCVLVHTMSKIPKHVKMMEQIMKDIVLLSSIFDGKKLITTSFECGRNMHLIYGTQNKGEEVNSFCCIYLVFARSHYEKALRESKIVQYWADPSIAMRIAMGQTTEWEELNKLYNPHIHLSNSDDDD